MSEFITAEKISERQENAKSIVRFIWDLTLLRWFLIPSFITILLCAGIPQYFLWAMGKYISCMNQPDEACRITHDILGFEFNWSLSLKFLAMIVGGAFLTRMLSWGFFELSGKWSTQKIHYKMVKAVSLTRTTFFDENPSGRLINRMAGDFLQLTWAIILVGDTTNSFAEILCVGILIMVADPMPALFVVPLLGCYLLFQSKLAPMLSHARELRSVAFGEVLHRQTDLIEGRDLFSRYQKEGSLLKRMHRAYEKSIHIGLLSAKIQWWGELWMGFFTVSFSVIVYLFLAVGIYKGTISPVFGAIIITAVLNLTDMFGFLTWNLTHLGESAANVRRIYQFVDLPKEVDEEKSVPARTSEDDQVQHLDGDIRFVDFTMSYRNQSPLILKEFNLTIPKGKKTGIVGKTGCGKTSVFQALFRMVYTVKGDILIGNQSIYSMEIEQYRSLFGVVPQDPYLFSGTLRYNLSGGNPDISDQQMKAALERVGLPYSLGETVAEGGKDYSMGERQLVCLARVLILNKNIILMDEPTSSVDVETDKRIQRILDHQLKGKTLITIAHRLDSLWKYDRIIEIKEGSHIREGSPKEMIPKIIQEGGLSES